MVVDHIFQLMWLVTHLVKNHMIMHWARSALQGDVRIKQEIPLMWACNVPLKQDSGKRVSIAVSRVSVIRIWESANVMALVRNHNGEITIPLAIADRLEDTFDLWYLILEDLRELTSRHAVSEVIDILRGCALVGNHHPLTNERRQHRMKVNFRDQLNPLTVSLASSKVAAAKGIHADRDSGHRRCVAARSRVRNIGANDQGSRPEVSTRHLGDGTSRRTTEFRVDFHQHIGDILWIHLHNVARLKNLGGDTPAAVTGLLDPEICKRVLVWDDKHDQLGIPLEFPPCRLIEALDCLSNVLLQLHNQRPI